MIQILIDQAEFLKKPSLTVYDVLGTLRQHTPTFTELALNTLERYENK
jgi:hypothetical protein